MKLDFEGLLELELESVKSQNIHLIPSRLPPFLNYLFLLTLTRAVYLLSAETQKLRSSWNLQTFIVKLDTIPFILYSLPDRLSFINRRNFCSILCICC